MSLENEEGPISVTAKEKASPIRVVLKNTDISQRKLSLEYPEQVNYWRIKLNKATGTLIVAFDLIDRIKDTMQLEVRIRYERPPTSSEYDARLKIRWNNQVDNSMDDQKFASLGTDSPNVDCRILNNKSFVCRKFDSNTNDTVWFSAQYRGSMPPNKRTWNFTSSIHEPECLFWNESKNMFDGTGVEVGHRIMMPLICLLIEKRVHRNYKVVVS